MARKAVRKASKTEETGVKRKPGRQPMTAEEKKPRRKYGRRKRSEPQI